MKLLIKRMFNGNLVVCPKKFMYERRYGNVVADHL